jgi:hypothetical protein
MDGLARRTLDRQLPHKSLDVGHFPADDSTAADRRGELAGKCPAPDCSHTDAQPRRHFLDRQEMPFLYTHGHYLDRFGATFGDGWVFREGKIDEGLHYCTLVQFSSLFFNPRCGAL